LIHPVRRAAPSVEARIAEDGEMAHIFTGYWQNEAATRAVLDEDEWLHTGDLGSLHENAFLSITDRKDIIITSGARTSTPENLENDLKQSPFISQAVMHATARRTRAARDARPRGDHPRGSASAGSQRTPATSPSTATRKPCYGTCSTPRTHATRGSTSPRYAQLEQVKSFDILDHELTQEPPS
jgi:long-chain acyl-CoA synthetase